VSGDFVKNKRSAGDGRENLFVRNTTPKMFVFIGGRKYRKVYAATTNIFVGQSPAAGACCTLNRVVVTGRVHNFLETVFVSADASPSVQLYPRWPNGIRATIVRQQNVC